MNNLLIIGSHVGMSKAQDYFYGAVQEAIDYGANTLMIYTGAPQNTKRVNLNLMKIEEGLSLAKSNGLNVENFVIHAPYIINLATNKKEMQNFGIDFLIKEIKRAKAFQINKIVLHPGSSVNQSYHDAIVNLSNALNIVLQKTEDTNVTICLETMAGKGNEIGKNFLEIAEIIKKCNNHPRLGVCLDTCHIHDAGYNLKDKKSVIDDFEKIIGLEKLKVIHINDSLNFMASKKDRHANLNHGHIGSQTLLDWIYEPLFQNIPKILETPWFNLSNNKNIIWCPPYRYEIAMIKAKKITPDFPDGAILLQKNI